SVEMKDLLFFVHSDHVFELCFHKAKTPISMVPFSMIFLGEFSIAIYTFRTNSYICSVGRHNPDRFMGEN
ncbi:MAG: hypothetical protein SO455_05945, partial [Alistipes senegalensis]|nr:hypothetical protein [Alistipes senegalensis]